MKPETGNLEFRVFMGVFIILGICTIGAMGVVIVDAYTGLARKTETCSFAVKAAERVCRVEGEG